MEVSVYTVENNEEAKQKLKYFLDDVDFFQVVPILENGTTVSFSCISFTISSSFLSVIQ